MSTARDDLVLVTREYAYKRAIAVLDDVFRYDDEGTALAGGGATIALADVAIAQAWLAVARMAPGADGAREIAEAIDDGDPLSGWLIAYVQEPTR